MFPKINKNGTTTVLLNLFVFGNGNLNGKPNLTALVTALQTYPDCRRLIITGTRSTRPFQPVEIKKILFMLVAHGMLILHFEPNMKEVVFRLAKASHNASVFAIQYHPYWVAMKSLVDLNYWLFREIKDCCYLFLNSRLFLSITFLKLSFVCSSNTLLKSYILFNRWRLATMISNDARECPDFFWALILVPAVFCIFIFSSSPNNLHLKLSVHE